jgi:hypothetical protein
MSISHAYQTPSAVLATASNLFSLLPSCLMTLAPVTAPTDKGLTQSEVEDVLSQCGSRITLVQPAELARQLSSARSDLHGHIEFAYVGLIENHVPLEITGHGFAFISVIGLTDAATAEKVGRRMAKHERAATSCRGFVCANVIVQRLALHGMNPDKLDRFLLERFAAAAANPACG